MKQLIKKILREETEDDDHLPQSHSMIEAIKYAVGNEYEGIFFQPWDEGYQDYVIKFHITKVTMWSTEGYEQTDPFLRSIYNPKPDSLFEGTVHVKIDRLLVGDKQRDSWERMYGEDDITETAWDDFKDYISDTILKWLPKVNVDTDISF
jgi:hypothetical protein